MRKNCDAKILHTRKVQNYTLPLKAIETRVAASYFNLKNGNSVVKRHKKMYANRDK